MNTKKNYYLFVPADNIYKKVNTDDDQVLSNKVAEEVFKEYRDLLSIYYNMVHLFAEFSDEEKIEGKVSAMCSYLAIKEAFDKIKTIARTIL